ncbi:MAG: hypothetical protein A2058_11095 [Ignavibacteria bacterium GWA2_36_19]|nr:MAG: hypothetical protein A2058_11095 [Ignavibacteria bacterium GWA2_36_19]
MKPFIFLLLLVCVFLSHPPLRAQIFSEAPVTISENGERLSNMIYVKFEPKDLIEIPDGENYVDGNSISIKYPNIRKIIQDFCTNKQLGLTDLRISKAIQAAKEEDTLFTDVYTGEIRKLPNLARVYIIKFPKQVEIETIASELDNYEEVEYSHGPVQLVDCAEYPNDYYYTNGSQWYLNAISAPEAWEITKGGSEVKIALIDWEGVELTHSDLHSKIVGGDNNPAGILGGHGTRVAGLAGAITNNTIGVASLEWNIKLITYQPYYDEVNSASLAQKIKDASDACANVINLSLKTIKTGFITCGVLMSNDNINSTLAYNYYYNWDYSLVRDAINYAVGKNSVIVASAGNTNNAISDFILPCESIPYSCYPAYYSNVIAVSGSQHNGWFVNEWNRGSFVDVNAPGRTDATYGLWSTDLNNNYTNAINKTSGTSFSAPQVSALAALIKSLNASLSPAQVKIIMENTADKEGQYSYTNGRNDYFGYGRINAYKAVQPPSAPQNLSYTVVNGHPRLSWSAGEWDVKLYEIWRDLGQGYVKISEVNAPATTYDDYDLIISASNPYSAWYYVKAKDLTNLTSVASSSLRVRYSGLQKDALEIIQLPSDPTPYQNFPNPFNPTTTIKYSVPNEQLVSIKLYNSLGQEIVTIVEGVKQHGFYQINVDASYLSSGIYLCTMRSGNVVATQKIILQK